ncbi:hypothetical protein EZV62_001404 [Acer yangbiense]|uniref:BED-type domain-containing protein n=1 Tax=Acer yangbiense TaxID=1000413 RepID=A0A5C7IUF1_9ROSI|nr:hypothetical protein EZV62_001404 [Acer yangbiense]
MTSEPNNNTISNAVGNSSSAASNTNSGFGRKRKSNDVGWEFEILIDEKNQDKVQCILCKKVFSGGVYRLKEHVANIQGNVAPCRMTTNDNQLRAEVNIGDEEGLEDIEGLRALRPRKNPKILGPMDRFASPINPGIPFNAIDNDSFLQMVEAIGRFGPSFKPPSQWQLREPFLKEEKRRSIMNLCVNCKEDTTFLSSKESSDVAHTCEHIFNYVLAAIEEVGPENVVQVVTNNASNNMVAAKMLKEKMPSIFWTSCATHTINLMLEGIGKLPRFKKTLDSAKSLTIFIYAHHTTLALMRTFTKKRDIVRPGVTRFASAFLTLQSILEKKDRLRAMFTSSDWDKCKWSKSVKGNAAYSTVLSTVFWNGVNYCLRVFAPLVFELGTCDVDHVSLITLLHTMFKKQTGYEDVPTDEYCIWVVLPWCSERMAVNSDSNLVDVFQLFSNHKKTSITFEGDNEDAQGDNEDGHSVSGDSEVFEVDSDKARGGVDEDELELGDGSDEFGLGYNSHPDDEFVSDSEAENMDAKIARLIKSNPFKQLVGFVEVKREEARAKWIASKFETLVMYNPNIKYGVISDMFFLSFEAQKKGFMEGCMPFIGIDGCHLKGLYGGVLLSAIALDANSGRFPLACCICEGETLESWSWFLEQLHLFLKYPAYKLICFISDRQKGVIRALKAHWLHVIIWYCARHIYANFRIPYPRQKLKQLFWKASKSYDGHEFKKAIREIGVLSMKAQAWARTYLNLMEFIRRMVMTRFQVRKEGCGKWKSELPPTMNKKIVENSVESRILKIIHAEEGKFELMGLSRAYTAKLQENICECGAWQISEVPYCHALAKIRHLYGMSGIKEDITQFIHPSLSKSSFLRTYSFMISPIPDLCV